MNGPEKFGAITVVALCAVGIALIVSRHVSDQAERGVRPSADTVIQCSDECVRACVRADREEIVFE